MGAQKQKTKVNQTTQSAPWEAQQPYIKEAFSGAQNVYKSNMTPNADMTAAWDITRNNINDPNSGYGKAKSYWTNILDKGGYDDNVFGNISSRVLPAVNSVFMGSGRTGGGLQGIDLAKELTQSFSPFAISQANMAANNLPALEANSVNALYNVGQQEYAYPWQNLGNYYGLIGANNWGGTSNTKGTTTNTTSGNTLGQIAGAATGLLGSAVSGGMLNGLGGMFGGVPTSIYNPTMVGTPYMVGK